MRVSHTYDRTLQQIVKQAYASDDPQRVRILRILDLLEDDRTTAPGIPRIKEFSRVTNITSTMPPPRYLTHKNDRIFPFFAGKHFVGRDRGCYLRLRHCHQISRIHCLLSVDKTGTFTAFDLASTNGTFVNDEQINDQGRELHAGDKLSLSHLCTFTVG